jgi:uncharacterized protein YbbK (DUF523 family)
VTSLSVSIEPKTPSKRETVFVSMCVFGIGCRYHAKTEVMGYSIYKERKLAKLMDRYNVIPVCGEQLGGLSTPREPCNVVQLGNQYVVVGRNTEKDYT